MKCLKEKTLKDEVPVMNCNVEHVLTTTYRYSGSTSSALTASTNTGTPSNSGTSSNRSRRAQELNVLPTSVSDPYQYQMLTTCNSEQGFTRSETSFRERQG